MAEGILKHLDPAIDVFSAGIAPAHRVHPDAILVMKEIGIDISAYKPKSVDIFTTLPFDYVITVCDNARETCPFFSGKVRHRLHCGFDDPNDATGTRDEILAVFRRVRDEIRDQFKTFVKNELHHSSERQS